MCPQSDTFWKYGFISYITDRHLKESIELPSLDIPLDLWETTHISKWEEFRMGIPTFKTDEWGSPTSSRIATSSRLSKTKWLIPGEDPGRYDERTQ